MPDLSHRCHQPELMDTISVTAEEMKQTLNFLKITNTYFGGNHAILGPLKKFSHQWNPGTVIKILDVGTGGADIPIAIATWARSENIKVAVTGIDLIPQVTEIAEHATRTFPEIKIFTKNFFEVDEAEESYDYVTASLLLHHISSDDQISFLQKADRLSKKGIIISDLQRSFLSHLSVSLLSKLFGNHIVKHDAPLSVRRSFTASEMAAMATGARLPYLKILNQPWFRRALVGEKI